MHHIDQDAWYSINETISRIYTLEGADIFSRAMDDIQSLISYKRAFCNISSNMGNKYVYFDYISHTIPQDALSDYQQHYEELDFVTWLSNEPRASVYRDTDVISLEYLNKSLFMTKWLMPLDCYWGAGLNVAKDGIIYGGIHLWRPRDQNNFTDGEMEILEILNEHLCRRFSQLYPNGISRSSQLDSQHRLRAKYHLTSREHDILCHLRDGIAREELAGSLCISENTVKKHLSNIYHKTQCKNIEQLLQLLTNAN